MGDPKIIQAIAYVQWENHWFGALMFENPPHVVVLVICSGL